MKDKPTRTILVTGATGYIGGRLVPILLKKGYRVRCLVRGEKRLLGREWYEQVEEVVGDVMERESLERAMEGVDTAYYLVHSLGVGKGFGHCDMDAAANFSQEAMKAGVKRIIYLGALADGESDLSEHLRSRQDTGDALRSSGIEVTEFRAGVIVGSGSVSFEMIRYLTERIPVMICPKWVYTMTQPIGVREVLEYLSQALEVEASRGKVIEIGGAEVLRYGEMMKIYASVRGLRRWLVPVPLLTPRLSSLWVNIVTPIPSTIARPLIEGLKNENRVKSRLAAEIFPMVVPKTYRESVERALGVMGGGMIESTWYDAWSTTRSNVEPLRVTQQEGLVSERRQCRVRAGVEEVYRTVTGIGGERGWYCMDWAWQLRGAMDRLVGGVGMRRGRRDAEDLRVGDAVDFWRVEMVEENRLLRLRAEMKVPGEAWLQFQIDDMGDGEVVLTQTAFFAPKGLVGMVYWYMLYPVHAVIFSGMIRKLADESERRGKGT